MIFGAHAIIFSRAAEETRRLLGNILGGRTVDAGGGWPILALPPAEVAVHPTDREPFHELYLMCDDLAATIAELRKVGAEISSTVVHEESWGKATTIILPGGGTLGLYEPLHPTAIAKPKRGTARRSTAVRSARGGIKKAQSTRRDAGKSKPPRKPGRGKGA
jgi:hypothetical protein